MAALPTFQPSSLPGSALQQALGSGNAISSWMTQAQERDLRAKQEARTQQQFQTLLPALQAMAVADQLSEQNDAASALAQQAVRAQWQSMKPQVISDLAAINDPANVKLQPDGTPDWISKYHAYEGLQSKYSALSMLPEGKAYYGMIEEAKKNAYDAAMKHDMAQLTIDRLQAMLQGQLNNTIQGQNNQAKLNQETKPAIAQAEASNKLRNEALTDVANQRSSLQQMAFAIGNLKQDVTKEQQSALGSGPVVGNDIFSLVRPSARQVNADIGDFANKIMSTVKNIRNVNEFRAVTASIPRASDPAEVQNTKIERLFQMNQTLTQRNDYVEQLLRADPNLDPAAAKQQAAQKYPLPVDGVSGGTATPEFSPGNAPVSQSSQKVGRFHIVEVK